MYEIIFLKNNNKIEINADSVRFLEDQLTIIRETDENLIVLDFLNKKCLFTLKKEDITIEIKVLNMEYKKVNNIIDLSYILETEPDINNQIFIKYLGA